MKGKGAREPVGQTPVGRQSNAMEKKREKRFAMQARREGSIEYKGNDRIGV
jgi:hypothetical protein